MRPTLKLNYDERHLNNPFKIEELSKYSSKNLFCRDIQTFDELDTYFRKYYVINYVHDGGHNQFIEYFNYFKQRPFKLRSKKLILTYYPFFQDIEDKEPKNKQIVFFENFNHVKELILEKLKGKDLLPKIEQFVISKEKNDNRKIQIYLEFNQQINFGVNDQYYLDLNFNNYTLRGIYKTVSHKEKEELLNYIVKCTNFIAEPSLMCLDGVYFFKLKDYLTALYNKEGLRSVKSYLASNTKAMLNGGASVLTQLERLHKKKTKIMIEQKPKQ
jgi:hypothetical protein